MIEEKTIPLHELKYYYIERKGFVFTGATKSSLEALDRLAEAILKAKVSDKLPEFIVRISDNVTAFVYPEECDFKQALVYQAAQRFKMMGMFEVDTLYAYLKIN